MRGDWVFPAAYAHVCGSIMLVLHHKLSAAAVAVVGIWVIWTARRLPGPPLPPGFDEAYTLSGCANPAHCGTFRHVAAGCTDGNFCPGGVGERSGSMDPRLCDGVAVYQQRGGGDGPVLYRSEGSGGYTYWNVGDSSALETCSYSSRYLMSATNYQPGGGPPTAPAYSTGGNLNGGTGWRDLDTSPACDSGCGIAVMTGGH